ncbi:MAG: antibiotic transporter ATP-binding protein [Chlorobi bacterium]|nr:antibiotic transporter ATP-binding protein [Chlorobiota bacterium]
MKILRRLLPFLKPYTLGLSVITFLSLILSLLSTATIAIIWPIMMVIIPPGGKATEPAGIPGAAAVPLFGQAKAWMLGLIQSFIIVPNDKLGSLRNVCLLVVGIFIVKDIIKYFTFVLNTVVEERMIKDIRDTVFSRTIGQSLEFFNAKRTGELISVLTNDVNMMSSALTPTLGTIIREPMQALQMLFLLLTFSPTLTLIAFSTSILSLVLIRVLTKHVKRYSQRMQTALSDITSRLQETFLNIRIIKGYSAERYELDRFKGETKRYVRAAEKHSATVNVNGPTGEILAIIALAVVLYYGGSQVLQGTMRAEELISFLLILFAIMAPINAVVQIPTSIQRGLVAAERVLAVMDAEPTVKSGPRKAAPLRNELQLLNVGFSYRPGHPVVRDVTLTIKRGQTLALVGPSGGGKSTLMDLMLRLYDAGSGGISLDGIDIREFDLESYRSLFGVVTQESILFNDSVFNNIAYGVIDATRQRVEDAARMANAHEFIQRLPQGYDTPIGDRGVLLSGGQRQRLAIARALARDPQILLFDEATSALDTESEMFVQEAINNLLIDRTAVVIAHRLSTIKHAHMIAVVENGAIVEYGRHDELLAAGNLYRRLYDVQFREN